MAPKEFLKTENFLKTEILKSVSIPTWSKIFKYRTLSNTEEACIFTLMWQNYFENFTYIIVVKTVSSFYCKLTFEKVELWTK